jgi:protein-tyrosine-phosphatase
MFRVLLVCTGSICRSPMAEHLMRDGLRQRLGPGAEEFVLAAVAVRPATLPTGDRIARAHAVVAAAASQRGPVPPRKPHDDDVIDPYRGPLSG